MKFLETRIPPPLVMLLSAGAMWALDHAVPLSHLIFSPWNRLGFLVVLAAFTMAVSAFSQFRIAQTTVNPMDPNLASHLVTSGVFRLSRNPMYLGLTLLLIGWAIWLGSVSPWIVIPSFMGFISKFQIIPEERALLKKFGDPYMEYMGKVGRWFTFFRKC